MIGMTNSSISKILRADSIASLTFLGVFPRNLLPEIKTYPCSLVLNTDTSDLPGAHWLAIYFTSNKECCFFDSYGRGPELFRLQYFVDHYSNSWEHNKTRLQSLDSSVCGQYCIYFIMMKCRGMQLDDIIGCFSENDFKFNDFSIETVLNLV